MSRYVVEFENDVSKCFDCPMLWGDECLATGKDVHDVKDTVPEWCPISEEAESTLVEMVWYLINAMPDNSLETAKKIRPELFRWFAGYVYDEH